MHHRRGTQVRQLPVPEHQPVFFHRPSAELLFVRHTTVNQRFKRLARDQELQSSTALFGDLLDNLRDISTGALSLEPLKEIPFSVDITGRSIDE